MTDLVDLTVEFQQFLEANGWEFCYIGGLAVQQWGEPRLTRDLDVSLLTRFQDEARYVQAILGRYPPRIGDAAQFALDHHVLLLVSEGGIAINVALAGMPFEESAVRRSVVVEVLPKKGLRLCTAEDLIVYKAFADRPRDWTDVSTIIQRQGTGALDWDYVFEYLRPLGELKESPHICEHLEQMRRGDMP